MNQLVHELNDKLFAVSGPDTIREAYVIGKYNDNFGKYIEVRDSETKHEEFVFLSRIKTDSEMKDGGIGWYLQQ